MILRGGPNIYGIPIGVLCLESYFPKPPGHVKNAQTFDFPVTYKVVEGATTKRIVENPDVALIEPFIEAARELEREGVKAITGSCGFLALFQRELADAVNIPVFTSSLIQIPLAHAMMRRDQTVGVVVARKKALTPAHIEAVGATGVPVHIAGMDGQPEFNEVIIDAKRLELDLNRFETELFSVVDALVGENPDIGSIVIECTDMTYFSHLIQGRTGRPVFDLITLTRMVNDVVSRTAPTGEMPPAL
jgi:Asp/Glu/hydantoin racemase